MQPINPKHQALLVHANTEKLFELKPGTLPYFANPDRSQLSISEMKRRLGEYRDILKKARRKLAMKYHPDRTGNDEKIKEINDAYDFLMSAFHERNIRVQRPVPVSKVVFYYSSAAYSNSTTTSTGSGWWA